MNVLITILVIQTLGYIYLAYRWFKKRPQKKKMVKATAKLKMLNTRLREVGDNEISHSIDDIINDITG